MQKNHSARTPNGSLALSDRMIDQQSGSRFGRLPDEFIVLLFRSRQLQRVAAVVFGDPYVLVVNSAVGVEVGAEVRASGSLSLIGTDNPDVEIVDGAVAVHVTEQNAKAGREVAGVALIIRHASERNSFVLRIAP